MSLVGKIYKLFEEVDDDLAPVEEWPTECADLDLARELREYTDYTGRQQARMLLAIIQTEDLIRKNIALAMVDDVPYIRRYAELLHKQEKKIAN